VTHVRGPYAEYVCYGCARWIWTRLRTSKPTEDMDEMRDRPFMYCAECAQQFNADEKEKQVSAPADR
jgi:DNA-directed RNA polymerase subunit RPC12/RpoP